SILSSFCLFLCVRSTYKDNYYVKAQATGANNGSNWTNAWNELNQVNWSGIQPGDTIWLAGGTYATSMNIQASGTSGNPIYIRRVLATDSLPSSAAGWKSSYDSQVIINVPSTSDSFGIGWNAGAANVG